MESKTSFTIDEENSDRLLIEQMRHEMDMCPTGEGIEPEAVYCYDLGSMVESTKPEEITLPERAAGMSDWDRFLQILAW